MEPTCHARRSWWGWGRFVRRHQVALSVAYAAVVLGVAASPFLYRALVPDPMDLGATVALRSLVHDRTFAAVRQARWEWEAGDAVRAEQRLERYLADHGDTQPGQLHAQAMSDASALLAEILGAQGRHGRAHRVLRAATARLPQDWWLWFLRGRAAATAGDPADATRSLGEAFRQSLVVPEVLEQYLGVLAEQGRYEDILWAFDHHLRARDRCAPFVQAHAGPARPAVQRRLLAWSGIPIEHGDFLEVVQVEGLARGERRTLALPGALFARCPADQDSYLQLRFQNLFRGITVHAVILEDADGSRQTLPLAGEQVAQVARPHSGGDCYLEIHGRFPWRAAARVHVEYSTPALEVPPALQALVANARRNVDARGGR